MATLPPGLMPPPPTVPGGLPGGSPAGSPGGGAPNPLLMALMQRLSQQSRGGPPGGGAPSGAPLAMAQQAARTPYGEEQNILKQIQEQIQTLPPRFLNRDSSISVGLSKLYGDINKLIEKIAKLPAAPVQGPPPGMPMLGGAAMQPPADTGPFG